MSGLGQYARFLPRSANSLLASEATDEQTARLATAVTFGQDLPDGRFWAMTLEADAPGRFSAALAINWLQHIPCQQGRDWIERLHHHLLLPRGLWGVW